MIGNYKIIDTMEDKVYIGTVQELENLTGINRVYYNWYATHNLMYQFRFWIHRLNVHGEVKDYRR